jgi:hypothetical protein
MHNPYDFGMKGRKIAYVRAVNVSDLSDELREGIGGQTQVFAIHDEDGQRLALVRDRKMAFIVARQNDFAPVTVH